VGTGALAWTEVYPDGSVGPVSDYATKLNDSLGILRGVTAGVGEEARIRDFASPAFAGFRLCRAAYDPPMEIIVD
jgi:hypothetical protein